MRNIYFILLGLIIFNGVLIALAGFFPYSIYETETVAYNVTNAYGETYGSMDQGIFGLMFNTITGSALTTGIAIFGVAILAGVLSKQVALFIGIGAFISVLCTTWVVVNGIVTKLANYAIVNTLVTLIIIAIGFVALLSVVEMLNAQGGVN